MNYRTHTTNRLLQGMKALILSVLAGLALQAFADNERVLTPDKITSLSDHNSYVEFTRELMDWQVGCSNAILSNCEGPKEVLAFNLEPYKAAVWQAAEIDAEFKQELQDFEALETDLLKQTGGAISTLWSFMSRQYTSRLREKQEWFSLGFSYDTMRVHAGAHWYRLAQWLQGSEYSVLPEVTTDILKKVTRSGLETQVELSALPEHSEDVSLYELGAAVQLAFNQCYEHADDATAQCLGAYRYWDKQLNQSYQRLMAVLPSRVREWMRTSQRTWIKYRDSAWALHQHLLEQSTLSAEQQALLKDYVMGQLSQLRAMEIDKWYRQSKEFSDAFAQWDEEYQQREPVNTPFTLDVNNDPICEPLLKVLNERPTEVTACKLANLAASGLDFQAFTQVTEDEWLEFSQLLWQNKDYWARRKYASFDEYWQNFANEFDSAKESGIYYWSGKPKSENYVVSVRMSRLHDFCTSSDLLTQLEDRIDQISNYGPYASLKEPSLAENLRLEAGLGVLKRVEVWVPGQDTKSLYGDAFLFDNTTYVYDTMWWGTEVGISNLIDGTLVPNIRILRFENSNIGLAEIEACTFQRNDQFIKE